MCLAKDSYLAMFIDAERLALIIGGGYEILLDSDLLIIFYETLEEIDMDPPIAAYAAAAAPAAFNSDFCSIEIAVDDAAADMEAVAAAAAAPPAANAADISVFAVFVIDTNSALDSTDIDDIIAAVADDVDDAEDDELIEEDIVISFIA